MLNMIVNEKPSVLRGISSVVGSSKSHKSYTDSNGYMVSWCFLYLVDLNNLNDYSNSWDDKWSFSQLPMIPDSIVLMSKRVNSVKEFLAKLFFSC